MQAELQQNGLDQSVFEWLSQSLHSKPTEDQLLD